MFNDGEFMQYQSQEDYLAALEEFRFGIRQANSDLEKIIYVLTQARSTIRYAWTHTSTELATDAKGNSVHPCAKEARYWNVDGAILSQYSLPEAYTLKNAGSYYLWQDGLESKDIAVVAAFRMVGEYLKAHKMPWDWEDDLDLQQTDVAAKLDDMIEWIQEKYKKEKEVELPELPPEPDWREEYFRVERKLKFAEKLAETNKEEFKGKSWLHKVANALFGI